METLDELRDQVREDLKVDRTNLAKSASDNPDLHAKYLNLLLSYKNKYSQAERDLRRIYKERYEYYTGRATSQEYKDEPMHHKIMKQEVQIYLDADEKVQEARKLRDRCKHIVDYLEGVTQAIKGRGFDVKNSIEYNKFLAGE